MKHYAVYYCRDGAWMVQASNGLGMAKMHYQTRVEDATSNERYTEQVMLMELVFDPSNHMTTSVLYDIFNVPERNLVEYNKPKQLPKEATAKETPIKTIDIFEQLFNKHIYYEYEGMNEPPSAETGNLE